VSRFAASQELVVTMCRTLLERVLANVAGA
jgi:hypothetical protein